MSKRPAVVDVASGLLWLLVASGAVVVLLVMGFRDQIADVWSPAQNGDSQVQPIDFVPVIAVLYIVVALTTVFLIPLFRHGHNWARHSLAGGVLGILVSAFAVAETEPPSVIRYCSIAAGVLCSVTVVFLWHVDAHRFCTTPDAVDEPAMTG